MKYIDDLMRNYILYKGAWMTKIPHLSQKISKNDSFNMLKKDGILICNDYDFDCKEQTSFWYIIKDSFDGMSELSSKVRNQVRKSQQVFIIRRITREELLEQGLEVYNNAISGYKAKTNLICRDEFKKTVLEYDENYDFWGCISKDDNKLYALAINLILEEQCNYKVLKADPKYLKRYPYYGLLYEMNRYYLEERKLKYVCDGARSITEHSNIQPFLEQKFNFRKAYCRLSIEYVWWMKLAVTILYPFRRFIPILKIKYVLNLEAMRRGAV